jgi:hypothetical protein
MKIHLHIGLESCGGLRLQEVLANKRAQLAEKGVLFPRVAGPKNHTRLFMALTAPDMVDPLRFNRGFVMPRKQAALREQLREGLARDIDQTKPNVMILSAVQMAGAMARVDEIEGVKEFLTQFTDDISITAYVDEPARLLARHYADQVLEGRARDLSLELGLITAPDWWDVAVAEIPKTDPLAGQFLRTQAPAFWLDYQRLAQHWDGVFGSGTLQLRSYDPARFGARDVTEELRQAFGIEATFGKADPWEAPKEPSQEWLARARQMNDLLLRLLSRRKHILPRPLWKKFTDELAVDGDAIEPASLSAISTRFQRDIQALAKSHTGLNLDEMKPSKPLKPWKEPAPTGGFRASQYLLAWMWRIDRATAEAAKASMERTKRSGDTPEQASLISPEARKLMPPLAIEKFTSLQSSSFKPHNRLGRVNEEELAAAFAPAYANSPAAPRPLPDGSTGRVIVGCMKNEAPYIVEWIAYHRAIGFDNFLIYTNDCTDGTDDILKRLDAMGIVHHRNNDDWQGNSPQQFALDAAMQEEVIKQAEWIAHIDVDEFVNVRCGNGTIDDFLDRVPQATNVAMTWRLFGHNGVTDLVDRPVIEQFTACAPKYCPKPHTVWGYKTMFKNIGVYGKLSCHRPNKLDEDRADQVAWVNGSGASMTREALKNGWRSSKKTIGYDLIQLNHYALRSAESYLIKRQRGRALHVDRSIGLNYWIRMDWGDHTDITIHRNLPRVRAEMDALLLDKKLRQLHEQGFAWHKSKAAELHNIPEFQELYEKALNIRLTAMERVAYALALDLES